MCFVKEAGKLTDKRENNHPLSLKLKEPHYWIEAWNEALRQSIAARRRRAASNLDYWNGLAGVLERWSEQGRSRERVGRVISWLEREGALWPGMEVLDIGAGTGDFAIPMARRGAKVTALEPAPAVMAALQKRAGREGQKKMRFIQREWEKINPIRDGLARGFDLVFASLSPGVRDPAALEKMIVCSREWCFLCDIAGGGSRQPGREELWRIIFGEPMPPPGYDIIYPVNYLYASGLDISFMFVREDWGEEQPVAEATAGLEQFFRLYTDITGEVKEVISSYAQRRAVQNYYREKYPVRLGMVLWSNLKAKQESPAANS